MEVIIIERMTVLSFSDIWVSTILSRYTFISVLTKQVFNFDFETIAIC